MRLTANPSIPSLVLLNLYQSQQMVSLGALQRLPRLTTVPSFHQLSRCLRKQNSHLLAAFATETASPLTCKPSPETILGCSSQTEDICNSISFSEEKAKPSQEAKVHQKTPPKELGAFQHMPMVTHSTEIFSSALRKARHVGPTKGIGNLAKRERNKGAKQLDALTKELALPLRVYVDKFPRKHHLHAYEYSLIDLTFGSGKYEEVLSNVNTFRKKILDVGKNYASMCAKAQTKRAAEEIVKEGFSKLEEHFLKNGAVIDELVSVAKTLRAMPVFNLKMPTLCLVGAPNVGKSSLVRVLSTGKPEVRNYPFTTRGISMGHIFIHTDVYQVTDTPGLLMRPDEERNSMERLTLAALYHLPTAVLYVHDLTGECGMKVSDQFLLYKEIKEKFHHRPWLDVVSKADLLPKQNVERNEIPSESEEYYRDFGPEGATHVSVQTGLGIDQLKAQVLSLLSTSFLEKEIESTDEENLTTS